LRIGLILPNGPELAMALLVTAHYCTAVPLNANAPRSEWEVDLEQCGADLVVGMFYEAPQSQQQGNVSTFQQQEWSSFRLVHDVANKLCIPYWGTLTQLLEQMMLESREKLRSRLKTILYKYIWMTSLTR
jgi:hypothetical protein